MLRRIETLSDFDALRARWDELYRLDAEAHVFLTWGWLRAYLPTAPYRWFILTIQDGERLVAALPLASRGWPMRWLPLGREIGFAADPTADYNGMLCVPGEERAAVDTFAAALRAMSWDHLAFGDTRDTRIAQVAQRLGGDAGITTQTMGRTVCRSVRLPDSWERYAKECISAKTRVNVQRVERRLAEAFPGFHVSRPTDADIDRHVEGMIDVNHDRWGGNRTRAMARYGRLFRNAYDSGVLRLTMYWDGTTPVAGGAAFVDPVKGVYGLYMVGFAEAYARYSPGKGLVGTCIRDAIESGYAVFDFLRGDEPYKAAYAPVAHETTHTRLARMGVRAHAVDALRPSYRTLKLAVARAVYGPGREL